MTIENWLTDVSSIWQRVLGVACYFDEIEQKVLQGKIDKYRIAAISATIQQYWECRWEDIVLKFVKPKATWSAFPIDVTYDGEETSDNGDSAVVSTTIIKKSQLPNTNTKNRSKRRKHNQEIGCNNNTSQLRIYSHHNKSRSQIPETRTHPYRANRMVKRDGKQGYKPSSACGEVGHTFTRCYLVLGQDKE